MSVRPATALGLVWVLAGVPAAAAAQVPSAAEAAQAAGRRALATTEIGPSAAQSVPLPVMDVHLHALPVDAQGPPPLALCANGLGLPAHDPAEAWPDAFLRLQKNPPCDDPVWSPTTDRALMEETVEIMRRRNVYGVLSGAPERVAEWRRAAPGRFIPGLPFQLGPRSPSPDSVRRLHAAGVFEVLAEVTNQYVGVEPSDPRFDPYLQVAEELDFPVGIHVGTGPPGAPYLGFTEYRARLHSPLLLEEALLRHPRLRLYVMHAGWPMIDDLLALMWAHPQVYVGVGVLVFALPRPAFYSYLRRIVEAGFGRRVMFGSDQMVWPGMIARGIETIEAAPFLTEQERRDILYENAARFFRLSEEEIRRHHAGAEPKRDGRS